MEKQIDLAKSVYELCREYPELVEILKETGFKDIANPGMLNTAGRFMNIPKGAMMKGIHMEDVMKAFEAKGFKVLV